jgi:hypothetical protein
VNRRDAEERLNGWLENVEMHYLGASRSLSLLVLHTCVISTRLRISIAALLRF